LSALTLPYDLPADPALDDLLADTQLGRLSKQLIVVLIRNWAWFKDHCWPSNATIAAKLGIHPKSVPRALRELEAAGWADRLPTDDPGVYSGRYIRLLWRGEGSASATPGGAPALPKQAGGELEEQLRDVTKFEITGKRSPQEAQGQAVSVGRPVGPAIASKPVLGRPGPSQGVSPIPAMIQALKLGAPSEARAELVNRIVHRIHDKQPATYGFVRKWVNSAADGVAGALEALAHGYAKAEAAIFCNNTRPGRVLVHQVKNFTYCPPAPSTIGATEPHRAARPVALAAAVEPAEPPPTVEDVAELETQARGGNRGMRKLHHAHLVKLSEGGLEVPPDVERAAVEALKRLA
jgi:hypothetical protein